MKATIAARPVFYCEPFRPEQIAMLIKLSETHYDSTCRAASKPTTETSPRGFLRSWEWFVETHLKLPDPDDRITVEWSQIDTSLKIMESGIGLTTGELFLRNNLSADFSKLLYEAGRALREWKLDIDTLRP